MKPSIDFGYSQSKLVDLEEVPTRQYRHDSVWKKRFDELPENKARLFQYNNRQKACQMRNSIRQAAKYWKISISTRIIHGGPAVHGTDDWLLYFWKRPKENNNEGKG